MTNDPIPRTLETPPRSTGNAQADFPIMIDWFYRAYQVIVQAVNYINSQVQGVEDISILDLPDPASATVASAQGTANIAYALAEQADGKADTAQSEVDTLEGTVSGHTSSIATNTSNISSNTTAIAAATARLNQFVGGTVTISEANTSESVTFGTAQADTN